MAASNAFYSSAPTVFMPPNNPDQYFASSHYIDQNGHSGASVGTSPHTFESSHSLSSASSLVETPGSLAGRKRSRGDIHAPEDENEQSVAYQQGAGLEAIQERVVQRPFELSRPTHISRKSQRINLSTADSENLAHSTSVTQARDAAAEPLIDEATLALGISWTRMNSSEARQISQAAYAKWIKNHYPELKDVEVWFEYGNEEMPAYLVKAVSTSDMQPEYYIFSHDLTEARLVTRDANELVPRLQLMPALDLVAPGRQIRAQSDSIIASQNEAEIARAKAIADEDTYETEVWREPNGICAAHAMEMD